MVFALGVDNSGLETYSAATSKGISTDNFFVQFDRGYIFVLLLSRAA